MAKPGLTAKQERFARLYASGKRTKIQAHEEAGYMPNAGRNTRAVDAHRLSKKPHVAEAIHAYTLEMLPPLASMREERLAALQHVKYLAMASPDRKVQLLATRAWFEFSDRILEQHPDTVEAEHERDSGRTALFKDLGALYRLALGENSAQALELEAVVEAAPANVAEVEQGVQANESPETGDSDEEATSEATEMQAMAAVGHAPADPVPTPAGEWRYEAVPGANPPRKRRVWVAFG